MSYCYTFERTEKKYLITSEQYSLMNDKLTLHMHPDKYGESTICNIYYDTRENTLISRSVESPVYKEKFRVRSYGVPDENATVFLELKKKYDGVVFKRRTKMTLTDAYAYLEKGIYPEQKNQIFNEIDYILKRYSLVAAMGIFYERRALYGNDDESFRITFDKNIRFRTDRLLLTDGADGTLLLGSRDVLMEVKATGAMPKWLTDILSREKIYSERFSKYGAAFTNLA